jgi:hypothetical protein
MEKSYLDSNDYGIEDGGYTDSQAKKTCIISLVLRYAVPVVLILVFGISVYINAMSQDEMSPVFLPFILMFVSYVFSWVLMGKVRRRRRDYNFGRILMWLYIGDTALAIPLMIIQWVLLMQD